MNSELVKKKEALPNLQEETSQLPLSVPEVLPVNVKPGRGLGLPWLGLKSSLFLPPYLPSLSTLGKPGPMPQPARTCAHTRTYIHMCICMCAYMHIYICIHVCTHTFIHAYTHIHTYTHIQMHAYIHTYSCIHLHASIHADTCMHIYMHMHRYIHPYAHTTYTTQTVCTLITHSYKPIGYTPGCIGSK